MHPIAHKWLFRAVLCGATLAIVCFGAWAQDSAINSVPVDRSVHAGVDETSDRQNEPPASPEVSKHPPLLSRWSPQMLQPHPVTSTWSVKTRVVSPAGMDEKGSSNPPTRDIPSAFGAGRNLSNEKINPTLSRVASSNSDGHYHFNVSLLAPKEDDAEGASAISHFSREVTPIHATGMTNLFDTNPFGHQFGTPFSSKKIFSDPAIRKQSGGQHDRTLPDFHPQGSPDSQSNLKP